MAVKLAPPPIQHTPATIRTPGVKLAEDFYRKQSEHRRVEAFDERFDRHHERTREELRNVTSMLEHPHQARFLDRSSLDDQANHDPNDDNEDIIELAENITQRVLGTTYRDRENPELRKLYPGVNPSEQRPSLAAEVRYDPVPVEEPEMNVQIPTPENSPGKVWGPPIQPMLSDKPTSCGGYFQWTPQRQEAALCVAEGMSYHKISKRISVPGNTIRGWVYHKQFKQVVEILRKEIREEILNHGVAQRLQRIRRLNNAWEGLQDVIESRKTFYEQRRSDVTAEDTYEDIPGVETGLVVTEHKIIGQGPNAREVIHHKVDTAILSELREIEQQAAKELGQWTEKSELTIVPKAYIGLDLDKIKNGDQVTQPLEQVAA